MMSTGSTLVHYHPLSTRQTGWLENVLQQYLTLRRWPQFQDVLGLGAASNRQNWRSGIQYNNCCAKKCINALLHHLHSIKQLTLSEKMKKSNQTSFTDAATSTLWTKLAGESLFNSSWKNEGKNIKDCIGTGDDNGCSEMERASKNNSSMAELDSHLPLAHPRSPYHNFQKHTVVLIHKLAKNMCSQLGNSPGETLARQMWSIFENSGIKSKKMLIILFGEADLAKEKYKSLLIRSYFGELCQESEEAVREAQSILRRLALVHLQDAKVMAYVRRNRHIKSKNEFFIYFNELLSQLREGPLQRFRLSSSSSQKILDSFQTTSSLNEPAGPRETGYRK